MKLHHALVLGLISVALIGCTGASDPTLETQTSPTEPPTVAASPAAASPAAIAQSTAQVLKTGSFASGEHPTAGTASLISQDGNVSLTLGQDFQTSELGPDLVVILHRSASALSETEPPAYPLNEGDYVVLAPLESFSGAQTYLIPDTVNLADYNAAGIWCRKFNATFGIAALQ